MLHSRTVILGEASESDSEEISLGEDNESCMQDYDNDVNSVTSNPEQEESSTNVSEDKNSNKRRGFSSSFLATLGSAASLSRLANYSPYNLLGQVGIRNQAQSLVTDKSKSRDTRDDYSLLHKTLYSKNQQLFASLSHLYKHPYEKASKDLYNISQRLVNVQKTLQDVDSAITKLKKDKSILDTDIKMIV